MKKQTLKRLRKEEGFFSAFVLVFLVTLGLMGIGASMLLQSESKNVINQMNSVRADYLMESAAFYSTAALSAGTLTSDTSFTIGSIDVEVDTFYDAGTMIMEVTVTIDEGRTRTILFEMKENPIWRRSIFVSGSIDANVTTKDSNNVVDDDLKVANRSPMPQVNNSTLTSMAASQGHEKGGPWTATDDYPSTSFYRSGNTPNVTHVYGDMYVNANIDIHGIFIVDGNVYLDRRAHVQAVLYLPNSGTKVEANSSSSNRFDPNVLGGIYGFGEVTVVSSKTLYVRHEPEWMRVFSQYVNGGDGTKIAHWSY